MTAPAPAGHFLAGSETKKTRGEQQLYCLRPIVTHTVLSPKGENGSVSCCFSYPRDSARSQPYLSQRAIIITKLTQITGEGSNSGEGFSNNGRENDRLDIEVT